MTTPEPGTTYGCKTCGREGMSYDRVLVHRFDGPLTSGSVKIKPQRELAITLPLSEVEWLIELLDGTGHMSFGEDGVRFNAIQREIEQVKRGGQPES